MDVRMYVSVSEIVVRRENDKDIESPRGRFH